MKRLALVVLIFSGCAPIIDTQEKVPCVDRCATGCCNGDPQDFNTECIRYDDQNDSVCGHDGNSCHGCLTYTNPFTGAIINTTCGKGARNEYGAQGCI